MPTAYHGHAQNRSNCLGTVSLVRCQKTVVNIWSGARVVVPRMYSSTGKVDQFVVGKHLSQRLSSVGTFQPSGLPRFQNMFPSPKFAPFRKDGCPVRSGSSLVSCNIIDVDSLTYSPPFYYTISTPQKASRHTRPVTDISPPCSIY